jgi:outer membrane protein assembly factor BamB
MRSTRTPGAPEAGVGVRSAITIGASGQGWSAYFGDQRGNAFAVDAVTGQLRWKTRIEAHRAAIVTGAPALSNGVLYVPVSSYEEVTGASPRYECCSFRGSLVALDAETGNVLWQSYTIPQLPAPVRKNALDVQLWGPVGCSDLVVADARSRSTHLRAYVTSNGEIIWDVDTVHNYSTVNGIAAHGGSLDRPPSSSAACSMSIRATPISAPLPATHCWPFRSAANNPRPVAVLGGRESSPI